LQSLSSQWRLTFTPLKGAPFSPTIFSVVGGDEKSRGVERHPPASDKPPASKARRQLERIKFVRMGMNRKQFDAEHQGRQRQKGLAIGRALG